MKQGTKVKVVAHLTGHDFDLGEIVERHESQFDYEIEDSLAFIAKDGSIWYMIPDEYEVVTQRWCFKQDDDGHNFLIPVELSSLFNELVERQDDYYTEFNNTFDQHSCDSFLNYSFENPL